MAVLDAMNKQLNTWERRNALNWLCQDNIDFFIVCDFAGVKPDAIKKGFLKLINKKTTI